MDKLLRRVRFSFTVSALLTLFVGLCLTMLVFTAIRKVESDQQKIQFRQNANLRISVIEIGLQDAVEQLVILNQLFRTFGIITREQFHTFTAPILKRYPEIQALSYQRLLRQTDRHNFEMEMRRRNPDFMLTEIVNDQQRRASIRDYYNVIDYLEPSIGNEAALGLDTAYNNDQTLARQRSRDTGNAVSTGLISLAQHKGLHSGFLVLAPVYLQGVPLDGATARERAAIGETSAVFRSDQLINTILRSGGVAEATGMGISIYASAQADPQNLAFQQSGPKPVMESIKLPVGWLFYDNAEPLGHTFTLAGNEWHLEVIQASTPFTVYHHGALYVLLGGLLSSVLAAAYVYKLVLRIATVEHETSERAATLQFANLRLSEDIALSLRTEKSLRLRERVIEVSANAIIICSANAPDYPIEYVNPAFERITGYSADEVLGRSLESLQGNSQDQQNIEEIRAALRDKREGHALLRNYRKDGTGYWNDLFIAPVQDEHGLISHFVVAQYDISAVMKYEAEMEFQASHDTLTGLANRNLLRERLTEAIADAERSGTPLWVVFVDLDRFKFINDTLGHEAGDALLKVLAMRLQSATGEADTVARLGGDEFVLVFPNQTEDAPGLVVLQRIMDSVAQPLMLQDHEFYLTCSMGIAQYPGDGNTAESLIKHADIAMYRAKEMGRNTFQFYTPTMIERTLDRLSIETDLRYALDRDEFVIQYQPQVSLATGRIVGMEVLLRWEHPVLGLIAPTRFIGLAEEMGLIVPIGAWVIRTACIQTKAWHLAGYTDLRVAVNLSPRQFTQKALAQSIADVLAATGLEPHFLELELTESMIMNDVDNAITILRALKQLGVHISIDDFGTGYSSLSYLRRFPIDVLKIDQSFVNELNIDADAAAIVIAIISLAHSLRLKVIAEGVETPEQLAFLRAHGCDQMQGYYFSRPVNAEQFELLLQQESGAIIDDNVLYFGPH
ncbi:bifunctional diguanylate cyclase/phosphodiesterase [Solimicrobium silvestre]|uniref:GGDEF: diguanylate cyclase (GGDEF) domain n=1 Tax=Solimicrobium silvestre TaxID=2099400 RepID=A0A2S9GWS3_9BURK|nr:EAL domain-containing protein [Solimicrobium silvestre]PRC92173.1 GGDEF: diguanylate cyclase (GGDEF) domain [Solimicrobium silvestre]